MAQRLRLTALSLLLVSSSTHGRTLHNRRQLRQPLESRDEERLEDGSAGKVVRSDDRGSNKNHGFYDLSSMTFDEKIRMIKTAYKVNKYSDSIDWDGEFEKFREAVRESRRSADEKESADEVMDEDEEEEGTEKEPSAVSTPFAAATHRGLSNNQNDRELPVSLSSIRNKHKKKQNKAPLQRTFRAGSTFDGDVFDAYEYSSGNCPDEGSLGVPCAPDDIADLCNKYDRDNGSFRECLAACEPGFCCVHDADRELNFLAPNCNTDENCAQYAYCYIAWWKLHDTIGPALFLQIEQDDEFYDVNADEIADYQNENPFFQQVLLHHFDDIQVIIDDGTVDNEFNADRIFLDPDYWETDI
mmetsp:Transcript_1271/g.2677  ORF Transcript_1271/g.2677 Transcript_1271/m.2677 type:complete len:357 (-) Transcript_1271:215-1285(-)